MMTLTNHCLVAYFVTSVDQGVMLVLVLVQAKANIQSHLWILSIYPSNFSSLVFQFDVYFYCAKCLPISCYLSFFYFEAFSTFLEWVVLVKAMHGAVTYYLDDFLLTSLSDSPDHPGLLTLFA